MELRGIDPLAFRMRNERSTTELQPLHLRESLNSNEFFLFVLTIQKK
jgi:hypothetical protein